MMLSSFAAREAIHVAALIGETVSMPESTYNEFLMGDGREAWLTLLNSGRERFTCTDYGVLCFY